MSNLEISELTLSDSFQEEETRMEKALSISTKKSHRSNVMDDWDGLGSDWVAKLASTNFVVKNCLGDGNCQFRSIETALTHSGYKASKTHDKLRRLVAKCIRAMSNAEFVNIIESYRLEKNAGEFAGGWDPYLIRTKQDFIREIKKSGFHFQGDDITLSLLSRALDIDFVILMSDYVVNLHGNRDEKRARLIILFYDKEGKHYKTVGYRESGKKRVQTVFERDNMPKDIVVILDKHSLFSNYIKDFCSQEKCSKMTYDGIISGIEARHKHSLSLSERKLCIKLIRVHLMNIQYFESM
jgi:OTU-like cysteine protease